MPLGSFGPFAIPNENTTKGQRKNPNPVAETINCNCDFIYTSCILQIEEDITKGHEVERDIFCGLSTGFVQCMGPKLGWPLCRRGPLQGSITGCFLFGKRG